MRPKSNLASRLVIRAALTAVFAISAIPMSAQGRGSGNVAARLGGSQEVPVVMTTGRGAFKGQLNPEGTSLSYELSYSDVEGGVTQAHIHLGQPGVNGGIMAFLCTDLGNGPAGTPECPDSPGTVNGIVTLTEIVGPSEQGVLAEEFDEFVRALPNGTLTSTFTLTCSPQARSGGRLVPASVVGTVVGAAPAEYLSGNPNLRLSPDGAGP